ncbi:hypothetical protein OTU49_005041 [Cherax quadricarinatus]|uniref:CUB domain-containing protein n=1 Tax=Cherax quadricarinatus TaxID=27406 RepID=A0AAW0X9T3_CHEQU|nr:uncharacterized protein LOC128697434 isoform X2 [Cherax quadricarinatus]
MVRVMVAVIVVILVVMCLLHTVSSQSPYNSTYRDPKLEKTCGGTSSARTSYFTSSSTTATNVGSCSLSISKSNNVCQLRLEMKKAELSEPDAEGACNDQYLEIQGTTGSHPRICGLNTGQHYYVDVSRDAGPFLVTVETIVANSASSWNIQVQQISCGSTDLAPTGCTQYYKSPSGQVKSFNYHTLASSRTHPSTGLTGTRHLQETYRICVRQQSGYCNVKWTAAQGEDYAFTLTDNLNPDNQIPGFPMFNSAVNEDCMFTDYLIIAEGTTSGTDSVNIICGSKFPDPYVRSKNFEVTVITNKVELTDDDIDNRGFHLNYVLEPC